MIGGTGSRRKRERLTLRHRLRLDPATEHRVKGLAARSDGEDLLAADRALGAGDEALGADLRCATQDRTRRSLARSGADCSSRLESHLVCAVLVKRKRAEGESQQIRGTQDAHEEAELTLILSTLISDRPWSKNRGSRVSSHCSRYVSLRPEEDNRHPPFSPADLVARRRRARTLILARVFLVACKTPMMVL